MRALTYAALLAVLALVSACEKSIPGKVVHTRPTFSSDYDGWETELLNATGGTCEVFSRNERWFALVNAETGVISNSRGVAYLILTFKCHFPRFSCVEQRELGRGDRKLTIFRRDVCGKDVDI